MVFKCKICGGSLDVKQGEKITVCEYCGVRQSIPSFTEPKTEEIYNRANDYLMHNEFDKAENLYNQILFDDNSNADAYWNILMCRYGVTYVKDPASGKYIPTCNRTLYTPIFNDENYKKALQYADETQRELYITDAKAIDEIQKKIISVSKHEKPFDIFISYKETETNGMRTQDSIVAQELYNKLTNEGYKVFFSRITLEDKAGTEYEPYIYAALASSKVMITVCSSKDNIESIWVKNEWSRFLSFSRKDSEKTLIPLYFDMNTSDLPEEFAYLTAYDMSVNGFEQELIRGIKKIIPLPVMLLEQRKRRNKILKKVGIVAIACSIVGLICSIPWFMKLPDYNAAMQLYYDKNYPEAAWAFDELGGYRDSEKMKETCEVSWRKSLASVITSKYAAISGTSYYISQQGTVETLSSISTFKNKKFSTSEIKKDIKYISITDGGFGDIYGLRENGFVDNSKENNHLEEDWSDIVQISPKFYSTSVALTSKGTMIYGDIYNSSFSSGNDEWLTGVSSWENIVAFDYCIIDTEGAIDCASIIGIKDDGTLCGVFSGSQQDNSSVSRAIAQFSDVKDIDVKQYNNMVENSDGSVNFESSYNIIALTNHGTLQKYEYGTFYEEKIEDTIKVYLDFYPDGAMYRLSPTGELNSYTDKILVDDIVELSSGFCLSRTGSIYKIIDDSVRKYSEKTVVYDEWVERMN